MLDSFAWLPQIEEGNGGRHPGRHPAPSSSPKQTRGNYAPPAPAARAKDIITVPVAAAAGAVPASAGPAAADAASALRGRAHAATLDGTRHNRNAADCWGHRLETARSSPAGRRDAGELLRFFRASAYPRTLAGRCPRRPLRQLLRPPRGAAASTDGSGNAGDSGGLARAVVAARGHWPGTSAGHANAATAGPPADKPPSSSGTAVAQAETTVRTL